MISLGAGLAAEGKIPFCSSFTCFATRRVYDQITISVAYPNNNVKIVGTAPGITQGSNGGTHMCFLDLAIMRAMPNMHVYSPCDAYELRAVMRHMAGTKQPTYLQVIRFQMPGIFDDGYVFEPLTARGEALLKFGRFAPATEAQCRGADKVNADVLAECPEKLEHGTAAIATKVRAAFKDEELWSQLAADCFSCGSCNTVCPTCYCFDVQDTWHVDQTSGKRTRYWDACLTEDFAKISLGEGATENFRDERGERFRHRLMRKAVYLNPKLGGPACVGCGRCSAACTADIADPTRIINQIMAS